MTCARFQAVRKMPERIQMLNSLDKDSVNTRFDYFKILLPIWSGPVDLYNFKNFVRFNSFSRYVSITKTKKIKDAYIIFVNCFMK